MTLHLRDVRFWSWREGSLRRGDLRIESGPRGEIVPVDACPAGATVLEGRGRLALEGFTCAHHHLYSALARGMPAPEPPPRDFQEILERVWWRLDRCLEAETIQASAWVAGLEALACGTTRVIDHHASPQAIAGSLGLVAEALDEIGLSSILCYELSDRDGPGPLRGDWPRRMRSCPRDGPVWWACTPPSPWATSCWSVQWLWPASTAWGCTCTWPKVRSIRSAARRSMVAAWWSGWPGPGPSIYPEPSSCTACTSPTASASSLPAPRPGSWSTPRATRTTGWGASTRAASTPTAFSSAPTACTATCCAPPAPRPSPEATGAGSTWTAPGAPSGTTSATSRPTIPPWPRATISSSSTTIPPRP